MKLSILTTALLAGLTLATPSAHSNNLASRVQARAAARHQSYPNQRIPTPDNERTLANVQYSNNWSGAVYENPQKEGPFYAVAGTFTVPEPKLSGHPKRSPNADAETADGNGNSPTAASAWVGIDGDTYGKAILQAGVDFYINPDGSTYFDAWYEWFPDYAYDFQLGIAAGDIISIYAEASSPSEGYVYVENQSTGQKASQTLVAPNEKSVLAGQNAEWIVEDFQSGGQLVNMVDFGKVTFSDAQAGAGPWDDKGGKGTVVGVKDATIIELKQGKDILTESRVVDDMVFEVRYKGQ